MDTIVVMSWSDTAVEPIAGDAMLRVAMGVYYHSRLNTLVVVKNELPKYVAVHLPLASPEPNVCMCGDGLHGVHRDCTAVIHWRL